MPEHTDSQRYAVATTDGELVDCHFGKATSFDIYEVNQMEAHYLETRACSRACHVEGHDPNLLDAAARLIADCSCVLVVRLGPAAAALLARYGVDPYEVCGPVEESLDRVIRYRAVEALIGQRLEG